MKKEKTVDTHVYLPHWLLAAIKQKARENRRTTTAEIVIALEEYTAERAKLLKPAKNGKAEK